MGSAKVTIKEIDLSTRVPSFPGVYGGIVIAAPKGPVNEKVFVTSDSDLLKKFTPNEKIEVGYDNAFFSALAFLEKSDKLWVIRAANSALYSGALVKTESSSYDNSGLPVGMSDPTAYVFDSLPDVDGTKEITSVTCVADVAGSLAGKYFELYDKDGSVGVWFSHDSAIMPSGAALLDRQIEISTVVDGDDASVVASKVAAVVGADAQFSVDSSGIPVLLIEDAEVGTRSDADAGDSGFTVSTDTQGVDEINAVDECLLIYAANQGAWGNDIGIKLTTYDTDPDYVKEPNAFKIDVYKSTNLATPVESWTCSRVEGHKDGYGINIFIDDLLEGSEYIRGISNQAVDSSVMPKDITTALFLTGGDNGLAVTDSNRMLAADVLANPSEVVLTVMMDGDNATPAYQLYLDNIAKSRKDCVVCMSTPLQSEANSSYINELLEYRKVTLNANTSYSAIYTPHVYIYDKYNDRNIYVAPDGYAAGAISESAANYEIWYPPAGGRRGIVSALDLRRRFAVAEMDLLYDAGINPLSFTPGRGIRIWGQKTLSARPSALDRLNVRLMLIVIEPAIKEALEDFLFELNDAATRALAEAKIATYMDRIQARKGVYDYRVMINEQNNTADDIDNHRMNVWLFVKPTISLEEIPFSVVLTSTGMSFDIATGLI